MYDVCQCCWQWFNRKYLGNFNYQLSGRDISNVEKFKSSLEWNVDFMCLKEFRNLSQNEPLLQFIYSYYFSMLFEIHGHILVLHSMCESTMHARLHFQNAADKNYGKVQNV